MIVKSNHSIWSVTAVVLGADADQEEEDAEGPNEKLEGSLADTDLVAGEKLEEEVVEDEFVELDLNNGDDVEGDDESLDMELFDTGDAAPLLDDLVTGTEFAVSVVGEANCANKRDMGLLVRPFVAEAGVEDVVEEDSFIGDDTEVEVDDDKDDDDDTWSLDTDVEIEEVVDDTSEDVSIGATADEFSWFAASADVPLALFVSLRLIDKKTDRLGADWNQAVSIEEVRGGSAIDDVEEVDEVDEEEEDEEGKGEDDVLFIVEEWSTSIDDDDVSGVYWSLDWSLWSMLLLVWSILLLVVVVCSFRNRFALMCSSEVESEATVREDWFCDEDELFQYLQMSTVTSRTSTGTSVDGESNSENDEILSRKFLIYKNCSYAKKQRTKEDELKNGNKSRLE